jgi:conjugal transfer pilus assembly protein TraE
MELKIRDSQIVELIKRRNLLTMGLAVAVLLTLIEATTVASLVGKTRIIVVPPEIHEPFWVSPKAVSTEYLRQMTDYFLTLILNVTPDSTVSKRALLLAHVHPSGYGAAKAQLIQDETEIKKRQISRFFVPISYEVNDKSHWVIVLGDLTIMVGQERVSSKRVRYRIQYQLESGKLLIEAFGEEHPHEPT